MENHYRNTNSVAYLLLCLFITSVTSHSYIRQFTDDSNTNQPQEERARPIKNMDVAHYLHSNQEISSRDHKVSVSSMVKSMRDRPPSTYSLKMESFNTLLKSTYTDRYESRPFAVGEYNWTLIVFPNGYKNDGGSGYLSLYVAIDNSTLSAAHKEIYADLRFYIFNKNDRKYFTIQDTDAWRFNTFKTMWGFPQVLPVDTFKDTKNGYLYDGDHCEFGVDVIIPSHFEKYERFSITENFPNPSYKWTIPRFSTLLKDFYLSDVFSIGGRNWKILVYPNGEAGVQGKSLSMYLGLDGSEKFGPYDKIYVRVKLQVLNQLKFSNVERQLDTWYNGATNWGYREMISLSDLKDSSKGFVVNDQLMVQIEMEAVSSTKYFPS